MQISQKNNFLKNYPAFAAVQIPTSEPTIVDGFVGNFPTRRTIELNPSILDTDKMSLDTFKGPLGEYGSFLVLDVEYDQVKKMRADVEAVIGRDLKFLDKIRKEGEAHVTTLTPVEAQRIVARQPGEPGKITMDEVQAIAEETDMAEVDLEILGVGSGSMMMNDKFEETFFLIVDSKKLRAVRSKINDLYLSKGGDPEQFDPEHFFPHITIGYTEDDIHENNGLIKDMENSFDSRFKLKMKS